MDQKFLDSIQSLDKTLLESNLSSIYIDGSEILIDSILDDGLLNDIPIVSTFVNLIKTSSSISSALLLKKIIYFLDGVKDIPPEKRYKMINAINDNNKYKTKVGEKLLYIIDRCEDHDKASLIAELFKAFLNKEIEYKDFLHGSSILNSMYPDDLKSFLELDEKVLYAEDAMPFVSFGLCSISFEMPELEYNPPSDWKDGPEEYKLNGGEAIASITDIGKKLREIFDKHSI